VVVEALCEGALISEIVDRTTEAEMKQWVDDQEKARESELK
jgi:hypothetical protein